MLTLGASSFSVSGPEGKASSPAQAYTAEQKSENGVTAVHLRDSVHGVEVSIAPSLGNRAYEMKVHGENILFSPFSDLAELQKNPVQSGIPFMGPWANRIDDTGFWANGKKYEFNPALGNYRKDGNRLPIHGLLSGSTPWQVTDIGADRKSAHVTSRFQFWKYPDMMAQWPFAHEYEMTYRLENGMLEVKLTVANLSLEAMPLAVGFHPYYRIPDIPRDDWILYMPSGKAVVADKRRIPSGEFEDIKLPNPLPLKDHILDDGFTDLQRETDGRTRFLIAAGAKKIEVLFGPKYPVAIIWEPAQMPGKPMDFICIEPMAGITNAINLHHAGKYPALQNVPAGGKWTESFWVRASGF
jgi:aldose 1-epimerase